ncbi:hypothetical protein CKA34_24265 (plasmid) [Rhizobium sp. 11515TR]|nr:hypothetical protein CKA34_24265 [Rhizobium sp. 11515TR]
MLDEKGEPPGVGHSVDQKFRQRFLQQLVMGQRQFARSRKCSSKAPPPDGQKRVGGKAAPEKNSALPAHPQLKVNILQSRAY